MSTRLRRWARVLAVLSAVALMIGIALPANADINAAKDVLASSNGTAIKGSWSDTYVCTNCPNTDSLRAWNKGSDRVTWVAYELLSHGDAKYNYFIVQASVDSTLNQEDYPYRSSGASVIIGAHGKHLKVVDSSYTKATTLGEKCKDWLSVGLGSGLGPLSVSSALAQFKTCGGGTKITVSSPSPTWHVKSYQNLKHATFYYAVKVRAAYKPDFKITLVTPTDYRDKKGNYVQRNTYQSVSTHTYCKVGAKGCKAA
jgi:hypothetical protein